VSVVVGVRPAVHPALSVAWERDRRIILRHGATFSSGTVVFEVVGLVLLRGGSSSFVWGGSWSSDWVYVYVYVWKWKWKCSSASFVSSSVGRVRGVDAVIAAIVIFVVVVFDGAPAITGVVLPVLVLSSPAVVVLIDGPMLGTGSTY